MLPVHKVHILLSRLEHLDTLIISITRLSVSQCARMLNGINLHNLEFFSANTLPHQGLVAFLSSHLELRSLILGRCEREGHCYLHAVPVLQQCSEIEGPSNCIASLISYSPLARVTARFFEEVDTHNSLYASFRSSTTNITHLDVDFSVPRDNSILESIANDAPHVTTLKLIERFAQNEVSHCDSLLFRGPDVGHPGGIPMGQ